MSPPTGTACADVHESSNAAIAAKNAILNSFSRMVGPFRRLAGTKAGGDELSKCHAMPRQPQVDQRLAHAPRIEANAGCETFRRR
jgi:hypothetical protein